jgi:hypothetical protein
LGGVGASCGPSQPTQFETYTDEASGFSIDYPQGWDVVTDVAHVNVLCNIWEYKLAKEKTGVQVAKYSERVAASESFSASELKEAVGSANSFSALLMEGLPDNYQDYVAVSAEELTINGIPAIKHTFTGSIKIRLAFGVPDTISYKWVQVYLVENGVGWLIHCSCPEESFDSYESTWDTVINSFRLL